MKKKLQKPRRVFIYGRRGKKTKRHGCFAIAQHDELLVYPPSEGVPHSGGGGFDGSPSSYHLRREKKTKRQKKSPARNGQGN
jgi:hypothetical protein